MATTLYMRNTTANLISPYSDVSTSAGASATTGVTTTTNGGSHIQTTKTAGGALLEWISGGAPIAGFTLAGQVTAHCYAYESVVGVNGTVEVRLFKRALDGSEVEIPGGPWSFGTELGTSAGSCTWSFTPTS